MLPSLHRNFGDIIISNFCLNHGRKRIFPRSGLLAMAEIIKHETEDDHTKARQILLLHASKGDIGKITAAQLFMSISQMQVIQEEDARMKIWKDLGLKLIAHKEVSQYI